MTARHALKLRLNAVDPPFNAHHGVSFGPQSKTAVEDPVPAIKTTAFDLDIDVIDAGGALDFKGVWVHGKKFDRFLYLSWGIPGPSEPFLMFARAKVKLADIPDHVLAHGLEPGRLVVCDLQATNSKGQPSSGTLRAPVVHWSVQPL